MREYKKPVFTKKHYTVIAEFLRVNKHPNKENLIENLIEYFKEDNPNFKEEKFLKAIA